MGGAGCNFHCAALAALAFLLLVLLGTACGGSRSPTDAPTEGLFVIRVCRGSGHAPDGEFFRALIRDPNVVAEAERLVGAGQVKVLVGPLVTGDGGFNDPWSWHLDPVGVGFAEATVEVCDGCPSFIEADLDYWLQTVGTYCPWSTEVISRLR